MRNILILSTVILLLLIGITNVYAGMYPRGYFQWVKGEFEIPDEIKKVTTATELKPFLDSNREFTRMAAVRRLGEIEGSKAIDLLIKRFEQEPIYRDRERFPLVKLEIVRTLGRIGTEQAKSALFSMLRDYWKKVSRPNDKGGIIPDRDSETITPVLIETLYKWSSDKEVFEMAKTIALSEDVKKYGLIFRGPESIGQRAWEIYLKGGMTKQGIVDENESAQHLLDFVDDIRKKGFDSEELGLLKTAAAGAIIERLSEAALSSLASKYEDQLKKEPREPKGFLTERHNTLRRRIGVLNKILQIKKEKEQKEAKMREEKPVDK